MKDWTVLEPAKKISEALEAFSQGDLPHEILKIDSATAAIVFDIEGVDYIATIMRVPKQRSRTRA